MCDRRNHPLIEIYRAGFDGDIQHVVRWCPECGSVVVDSELDGRVQPGAFMLMKHVAK